MKNEAEGVRHPGGRPRLFSWSLAETLLNAIRAGAYVDNATNFAGIHRDTLYGWLREGDRYLEQAYELAQSEAATLTIPAESHGYSPKARKAREERDAIVKRIKQLEDEPWTALPVRLHRDLARFSDTWRKAQEEAALRYLMRVDEASKKDGRLALEFLSRRFPELYGRRRLEVSGPGGKPVEGRVVFTLPPNGREAPGVVAAAADDLLDEEDGG